MDIPVVTVLGKSKSGKTTLLEKIIAEVKRRRYKVGTLLFAFQVLSQGVPN
ncbi:MAG: molybdopterin-guanine dinucleotide biosynthesis protein MobB [Anaerolineales bacterium]|nr:molybdopterin-guanine dinucleotide biosynthesis protein MobB [Anaerolineales bacterium]